MGSPEGYFQATQSYEIIKLNAGESTKTLDNFVHLFKNIYYKKPQKTDIIIAIGGGTISDVVGFISQICLRGIPLILIPTTLLAQVDAAIGGKNGLNFSFQKNKIGSFYYPKKVICDLSFLYTLKEREFVNGIAEVIKILTISDAKLLWNFFKDANAIYKKDQTQLLAKYINAAISRKIELLSLDPFENSSKRLLNFGHTFAHTLEELTEFNMKHGEAVFIGMLIETKIGAMIGITSEKTYQELYKIISEFILPDKIDLNFSQINLLDSLNNIRKFRGGNLNIVMLKKLGDGIIIEDVPDECLIRATESVFNARLF